MYQVRYIYPIYCGSTDGIVGYRYVADDEGGWYETVPGATARARVIDSAWSNDPAECPFFRLTIWDANKRDVPLHHPVQNCACPEAEIPF